MKRTFLFILLAVITLAANAQTTNHFTFQDLPITGTINQFDVKIKALGWKLDAPATKRQLEFTDKAHVFNGTFEGMKGVLDVKYTNDSHIVYSVFFTQNLEWSKNVVKAEQDRLFYKLKRKYPNATIEKNQTEYDEFPSYTITTDEGEIWTDVNTIDGKYQIEIRFTDKHNGEIFNQEYPGGH